MNWLNSILILLVAFVAVFIEASFDGFRHILGAQIDLLPALTVYTALSSGLLTMTSLAVFGGLWFDSLSASPIGITILPLFVVGLAVYARRDLILRGQLFAQFVLGLIASSSVPLMTLLLLSLMRHAPALNWVSVWQWLVMSAGGAILTPICFKLFDALDYALIYRPNIESGHRPNREIKRGRQ